MRPAVAFAIIATVALGSACERARPLGAAALATCADAARLACTGLYGPDSEAGGKRIAPAIAAYQPGFRLWSDGLEKLRYVYLPPGSRIDTTDMDEWLFPVGTKFWKEFRWQGKRIETRLLEKTAADEWRRATFVWNADESDAREEIAGRTVVLAGHGPYDIPGREDCGRCHGGRRDNVLGFEALALAAPEASGVTLQRLVADGRLSRPPAPDAMRLPGTALDQQALGWLHMNCGVSCHNASPAAGASFAGLDLKLAAAGTADVRQTPALRTALDRPTTALGYRDPRAPKLRIVAGRPGQSAIYFRASSRAPTLSMPPLATQLVDADGLAVLDRWIVALAYAGHGGSGTASPTPGALPSRKVQ